MGLLKKKKFLTILKSVGLGLVDTVLPVKGLIGGIVKGVKEVKDGHLNSEVGGKGNIDFLRLTISVCTLITVIAWLAGWITFEELKQALKLFN